MRRGYPFWLGVWHAGLGPAVYTLGLTGALSQLSGRWRAGGGAELALPLGASLLGSFGLVLLDRVKWSDELLDPADVRADARRAAFLRSRANAWRLLAILCVVSGAGLAWVCGGFVGSAVILLGMVAITMYAGAPAGRGRSALRLKDIPVAKNVLTAGGLVAIAGGVTLGRELPRSLAGGSLWLLLILLLVVTLDAMMCDIPDLEADRAYGARTVPALIGVAPAWGVGVAGTAVVFGVWAARCAPGSREVAATWGGGMALGAVLAAGAPTRWIKTLIDVRPALITLAVGLVMGWRSG